MTTSSPSIPPSFDPALDLHSDVPDPPSESFSDELEALNHQRIENIRNKVVIQHRAWNLSDIFRSDDDIRPDTPTKSKRFQRILPSSPARLLPLITSSPPRMPFMSSPAAGPSGPPSPTDPQKRKNDEPSQSSEPKRQRMMGGFVDDDDDDEDELAAFGDAQMGSQFEIQEEPMQFPIIPGPPQKSPESTPLANPFPPSNNLPTEPSVTPKQAPTKFQIKTCSGRTHQVASRPVKPPVSYEQLVAGRSTTAPGRAQKSYYGIDIHTLLDEAAKETEKEASKPPPRPAVQPSIESHQMSHKSKKVAHAMWTEKYRARKFTDLIGDERTHRWVLRWLKGWDPIVFPNIAKSKPKKQNKDEEERQHRKVMLLCGPPGLGKTTLAHVCAKQAGYEVLEINASDERSKDVVKGRIRDALATENVKGMNVEVGDSKVRKAGRPVCVVVDEVDGVVSGTGGGGEGGFMKALIDLVILDQKNTARLSSENGNNGKKKKGDNFRFLRPLILVCNDVYHPSLRPLRASSIAEIIHVRQAPLENVVSRMKNIFTREGIPCDNDGVRRLCEASWGLASRKQGGNKNGGSAEGDIRSVLVAAEWVAHKLRNDNPLSLKLSRTWLEDKILNGSSEGGVFFKGLNRGGSRDIVGRVFTEGAGFPDAPVGTASFQDPFQDGGHKVPVGVADLRKRHAINKLREMVDASDEHDRCVADCFTSYPLQSYQDDTFLSKPNIAYDWLHFHDSVSSQVYSSQSWELMPYLSQSVLAFHHLFASGRGRAKLSDRKDDDENEEEHPFSGPRAEFAAFEAQKQNKAILTGFQTSFSAPLSRLFRSTDSVITDLIPNLLRMLSPDVKPVIVRGNGDSKSVASVRKESERVLIQIAVRVMAGLGVTFDRVRVEGEGGAHGGWAYRMEPPIDSLVSFSKTNTGNSASAPVRFAVRQVLDQEYRKESMRKQTEAIAAKRDASSSKAHEKKTPVKVGKDLTVKRDFFGRVIQQPSPPTKGDSNENTPVQKEDSKTGRKVWVTYHDGFSNAVRKPISMGELLAGL